MRDDADPAPGDLTFEGCLDRWEGRIAYGWAWRPQDPSGELSVEAVANDGRVLASVPARSFRGDLPGRRGGRCGFRLVVPHVTPEPEEVVLRVRDEAAVAYLAGPFSQALLGAPPSSAEMPSWQLAGSSGAVGWLDFTGPHSIGGWVHGPEPFDPAMRLELWANRKRIATARANLWRSDLEDLRLGNGSAGFDIPYPLPLYDLGPISIDLRDAENGTSLLAAPLTVELTGAPVRSEPVRSEPVRSEVASPPVPIAANRPIELSIVVNFYNMHREAERTLTALSRAYQRQIEDLAYEVICLDNGSTPPMDADWVASFGPEFRLIRPDNPHPSPIFSLNQAAANSRGRFVAMMIDGAHILSPHALHYAMASLRDTPGAVVALRGWFVGGDQRWLSQIGYTRDHSDILFDKIGWPRDGYRLFEISSPIFESPNHWVEGMVESNCLFISREAWQAIGGYDEAFDMPGAGFANLDLFVRAGRAPGSQVIALVGEATFHQFHDGTTTNVELAKKDALVRQYSAHYEKLRGYGLPYLHPPEIEARGSVRADGAYILHQRSGIKVGLGLTDKVRPIELPIEFDHWMRANLRGVYAEAGMRHKTLWAGQPTDIAPADLVEIQQMLWSVKPEVVILKNVAPGLTAFCAAVLRTLEIGDGGVINVRADPVAAAAPGTVNIVGHPLEPKVLTAIEVAMGAAERTCVIFQALPEDTLPLDAIARYAEFVSAGGYLVVLNAAIGQPTLGDSTHFTARAIDRFLASGAPFVIDYKKNAHLVTTCPDGFLYRLPDSAGAGLYDPPLDVFEGV